MDNSDYSPEVADAMSRLVSSTPQIQPQIQPQSQDTNYSPEVSDAMSRLTPSDVSNAQAQNGSQAFDNLCEKFVEEQAYGHSNIFPSAVEAWNYYAKNGIGHQDPSQLKPGDLIYFSANKGNGNFGHTGIYQGEGNFISATSNGVQSQNVNDWTQKTGQQILGFVPVK